MPTVTSTLKQIITDQERRIITGQEAVVRTLEVVRQQVAVELLSAPTDSFTSYRLRQTLAAIDQHLTAWSHQARLAVDSGLTDSWGAGAEQLTELAGAAGVNLGRFSLSSGVLDQLKEFSWGKISGVANEAATKIKAELTLGMLGQKTSQEVAAAIVGTLPTKLPVIKEGRPVFKSIAERAEVITGTELGRAFSMASQKSMAEAADTLPALQKMWLHAGHPKVGREIHLLMHGQIREIDKPFYQAPNGYGVQFPRDPNAPISEVIRCGCTHVPHLPEWGPASAFAEVFADRRDKLWMGQRNL